MSALIHALEVHKSYRLGDRSIDALRGATLSIDEPGFYAIMGPSGSGKSTLLHLLAALDTPDKGELHVAGRRIDTLSEKELTLFRRREIGVVFQQFNLIPTMTARQNVELPGLLAREPASFLRERSRELMETLGVWKRADHRPDALSGGEQQRVAIARALLFSPKVLLADEPTGALDSKNSEILWRLLAELADAREMTIVMVTHEPAAAAHCREVFILHDGRVTGRVDVQRENLDAAGLATRSQQSGRTA
ncbi:MAG: ABC transporter ATP-binding protein [Phycisphaeraceae bacterium]|nr:ABC transporter ATP-binding protein [Phycisphaeraceae bacterium]